MANMIALWQAVFECPYEVVLKEFRAFFGRCQSREVPVEAFGFMAHHKSFAWIEADEIGEPENRAFVIKYCEKRQGEDGIRSSTLGGLSVVPYRAGHTAATIRVLATTGLPSYWLNDLVRIGRRLEKEASAAGVVVRRIALAFDPDRTCMVKGNTDDVLRVMKHCCRENSGFGFWLENPETSDGRPYFLGLVLQGRGGDFDSARSFLQASFRNESGILEGVQAGERVKLTVAYHDMSSRPRFWQYWETHLNELKAFGFLVPDVDKSLEIYVEDIGSFEKAAQVSLQEVQDHLPLDWYEQAVQEALEDIIGEPFSQKDWGGEDNDLYTSRVRAFGRPVVAAFMLKGKGTKGQLTIDKCGKNGDQIQRLFRAAADLYVVQHTDEVSQAVRNDLRDRTELEKRRGRDCRMCVFDGYETARILKAYGKL